MNATPSDPTSADVARPDRDAQRSRLLGIKLRALVAEHLGVDVVAALDAAPQPYPTGSALLVGPSAWVLIDGDAAGALGGALAWAIRQRASSLNLVVEQGSGVLARRATRVTFPVSVWFAEDRTLLAAVAEPLSPPTQADPDHVALAPLITAAGADVAIEHGVVFGEVRGLEVCRVVDEPTTGTYAEVGTASLVDVTTGGAGTDGAAGGVLLEVGVGANDREAFRLLHGDIPTVEALAAVVDAVARHRTPDAPQHPLNRLARERAVRWRLQQQPGLVGMESVVPAEPPVPRPNVKTAVPCVATAVRPDGATVTLVCSSGVDLDLVGYVADVQSASDEPVVVVLTRRDLLPITAELLATLSRPVTVVTVD